MTACNQDFQMLAVLADSEQLTTAEQASLAAHATSCPHCRQVIAEMSSLAPCLTLATRRQLKMPRGFQARFLARAIQEGISLRQPARSLPTYAFALASFAVLLLCAVGRNGTIRPTLTPASHNQRAMPTEAATAELPLHMTPGSERARPVHRVKPAALHPPRMFNASAHFVWPQSGSQAPTGFDLHPVFLRDLHPSHASPNNLVTQAALRPAVFTEGAARNRLDQAPFAINMASLILREPPKIHLGEVAITDLTFIPTHP